MASWRKLAACLTALAAWLLLAPACAPAQTQVLFKVKLSREADGARSGRLLVFAEPWDLAAARSRLGPSAQIQPTADDPIKVFVAAKDVRNLRPGQTVSVSAGDDAFPQAFSSLPPGSYALQAVLDVDRNYPYANAALDGDLRSDLVRVSLPAPAPPNLNLTLTGPAQRTWSVPASRPFQVFAHEIAFQSPALTAFHGKPTFIRGYVVTPPGYETSGERYPTVYRSEGFGGSLYTLTNQAIPQTVEAMQSGAAPKMIWVFLDHSGPTGTHEFANSANNGPWGKALTEELIPWLEANYRMDGRASGRFLTGHSSGGWMAVWDQVAYPKMFGGAWAIAPDPLDFHDFSNLDLYDPRSNAYRTADGAAIPLVRRWGEAVSSFEVNARLEDVLGGPAGQVSSFDWVFSPRGRDGRPQPLFDHRTGDIDQHVAAYWREHYDVARIVAEHWDTLKPDLNGKLHLIVGTEDTYYLDGSARRLKAVLDGLGAVSSFRFVAGRDHSTILQDTGQIPWEMYAIARPGQIARAH